MRNNTNSDPFDQYYKTLTCKLFVIGQSSQGESIIFVLYGDGQTIYSCVIDSFTENGKPVPEMILQKLNIRQINDLFWTHPHDDHSAGIIETITNYHPTHIFIPAELHTLPSDNNTLSKHVLDHINQYRGYDRRRRHQPQVRSLATNSYIYNKRIKVGDYFIPFQIFTLAPCSGVVRFEALQENASRLNDYSIVLEMVVGDFSVLLSGDIENRMIEFALEECSICVPVPNVLKIPHHGSKGSTNITNFFDYDDKPVDLAVTTAKRSSSLPTPEALFHYTAHCNKVFRIETTSTDIAVWGISVDILNATITQIDKHNFLS